MLWTHFYDLIFKLITMAIAFVLVTQIPFFADKDVLAVLLILVFYFVVYNAIFRTFASYLYCRFTLKMDVDLSQAKQLNNAFSPILPINLQWLPMRELKGMDDALKFQTALNLYSEWEEEKRQYWVKLVQGFKNSNLQTKILTLAMYCLVIYFLIAGFLNLPPVGFLGRVYCMLFYSNTYPPFLIGLLLAVLAMLFFKAFDKNIK